MNLCDKGNMLTEMPIEENVGGIKEDSTVIDLDLDIGKLSVSLSPLPYAADQSSVSMVKSDASDAGLHSVFDSICINECIEPRDSVEPDIISDAFDVIGQADLSAERPDEGEDTSKVDSRDSAIIAEPFTQGNGEAEILVDVDKICPQSHSLIVYTSSRRRSMRTTISKQNNKSRKPPKCRSIANKNSVFDFSSLQILKRSRSSFSRARSSVWGNLGNILPAIEENSRLDINLGDEKNLRRVSCGKEKNKAIRDQTSGKSTGKGCIPTRHISLKVRIGNKSCSLGNAYQNFSASGKDIPDLTDIMGNELGERVLGSVVSPCERKLEKLMPSDASAHVEVRATFDNQPFDFREVRSLKEGDNLGGSTDIRCSDVGTSPDSEVINTVPDALLCEKGLQDLQDSSIVSKTCVSTTDNSSLILSPKHSKKGKKKDKLHQGGNFMLKKNLTGAETRNNGKAPVYIQDVSSLSSPQTKSKRGNKKDKLRELGNSSVESNLTGAEVTNNSNAPADCGVGQKVGDVSYCSDASMTRTAKPHLNGAEMDLCSGLVDASASSNLQVCDTLIPCSSGKKFPKPRAKSRVFLNEEDKTSENDNKNSEDGKLLVNRKVAASGDLNGVASILQAGNQTSSNLEGIRALSNDLSGPVNCLPISPDGVRDQYDPPRNAWVLCDECQKWRRIPATLADQINETECEWTCRDNYDRDFADCSIPQEKSDSEINEELGISDASCEEDACGTDLKSIQDPSNTAQQSSWSLIKSNLFLSRSRKTQTIDEVMVCHCKPPSDGRMGCGEKCLNRMLNIECVRGTCPCGERCSNQQFQKRNYSKVMWFKCGKKGYGLQALEDIAESHFLIEYVGEVLDVRAYEARQKEYAMNGHKHFYFMTLNGSEVIDACSKGNLGRFINHSCDPNCRTEKWMVNGEVCIGLFALRDIKKGEEITFDYNFVRVFGAAAKKCVCGSPNCRGYIGGDLTNSEVIAQDDSDDEYAEPVMICEDGEMNEDWNEIMSNTFNNGKIESSAIEPPENIYHMKKLNCAGDENKSESHSFEFSPQKIEGVNSAQVAETREGCGLYNSVGNTSAAHVDEKVNMNNITGESLKGSEPAALKIESEVIWSRMHLSSQLMDSSLLSDGIVNTSQEQVFNVSPSKSFPDKVECKRKIKYASRGRRDERAKSNFVAKTNRSLSSIKKGKPKANVLNGKAPPDEDKLSAAQHKSKKIPEHSLNNHVEAVEEKLNELLDPEGGISKRKDASRGYLKLLFLTAATGNNGHGEAIQSNRDLSMILDALLKTKSRSVLVDIINRNGLQMLHNIMKRSRKEFTKTPILRKLLKVLEYLATREILTLEHITGGPPCPGVESFKDSILTLTEHTDKQVYQIARNFRDKWIPRSFRKNCCMERDDARIGFHQHSSHGGLSVSYDHRSDQGGKPTEMRNFLEPQSVAASGTTEASTLDLSASGGSCGTNEPRTRKRKSRWDTPPVEYPHSRTRTNLVGDTKLDIDDDIPPGFSSPYNGPMVPSIASSTAINHQEREMQIKKHTHNTILGDLQFRFVARMPLSYGVPLSILQQYGIHQAETSESWAVAPGVPFHSFPPLPPRSSSEVDRSTSTSRCAPLSEEPMGKDGQCRDTGVTYQTDQQHTQICNIDPLEKNAPVTNDCPDFQQGGSCSLGRKYFRQQKSNHLKLAPPWVRMRNGWGVTGNNTRNGLPGVGLANGQNDFRNSYNSDEVYRREF